MKDYELSILYHPDLETNLEPAMTKVKKIIESAGGKIKKEENDGKKRLSYSIKGQDFAVYYYYDLELPAEVLRYLLVRADAKRAKLATPVADEKEESTEEKEA